MEENTRTLEDFPLNIQQSINSIIERENYTTYDVCAKSIFTNGNNFLGELFELNISGETIEGRKELNIFLKQIINNDEFRVYSIPEVYAKEAFVYNELSEMLTNIQIEANIPESQRYKFTRSYKETSADAIILENIVKRGYKPGNRFNLLTLEIAESALTQLAKFHALSFVLRNRRPTFYENKIKTIKQSFVYDSYWDELVTKMCDISMSKMAEDVREKIKKFVPISLKKYPLYMNGSVGSVKCLCHGDFKINNIMMKKENGVQDVIPIDYQQIYYGNPVVDLIYFLYAASDRQFRNKYLYHLKDHYYAAFSEFLICFDIDAKAIFPKEKFDEDFDGSLEYGLMFCLYMYPFFFASEEESPDGNDDLSDVIIKVDDRLYDRIQGVVDDFIDFGIL